MAARGGGTGLERAGFPPRPVHLKLVVVAGARSVPERSGCDGETGSDDFMRRARLATAADGDRARAANHFGMHRATAAHKKPGCVPRHSRYLGGVNWQEVTALVIVAATAAAFGWSRFRPRKFNFQRDTHCGCSSAGHNSPPPSIRFHARKGEAARVIVKTK